MCRDMKGGIMYIRRGCEPQVLRYQIIVLGRAMNQEDNTTNICEQFEDEHIYAFIIYAILSILETKR